MEVAHGMPAARELLDTDRPLEPYANLFADAEGHIYAIAHDVMQVI